MISSQGLLDTTMIRFVHTLTYPQPKSNFRIAILNRYNQTQPSYLNDHYLNANIVITLIWNNVLISKKLDFLRSRKFSKIFQISANSVTPPDLSIIQSEDDTSASNWKQF